MKKILCLVLVLFTNLSFAQSSNDILSTSLLSPFITASNLITAGLATFAGSTVSISASVQARGVAAKEQLRDELVALNDDMVAQKVTRVEEVRQLTLRELMLEIKADKNQMEIITNEVKVESELNRLATAILITLMSEE